MATEVAAPIMNGNYGTQPSYTSGETATQPVQGVPTNGPGGPASGAAAGEGGMNKDEIGWYFVEQYYTTLSRSPERLHLFYAKRSQFVSGVETEKVSVSVGQRAISDRIKEMGIRDCKVRVTNVDSQESGREILIQVIGEMSNRSAPPRKFVQTFVLAEQTNGYFVLNDIFRYLADEEDDDESEAPNNVAGELEANDVPATANAMHTLPTSTDRPEQEKQTEVVDTMLEKAAAEDDATPSITSGTDKVEEPAAEPEEPAAESPEEATQEVAQEETTQLEVPKDPEPSPAAATPEPSQSSAAPAPPAEPAAHAKPAAPKSWASLVAANKVAPAVPNVSSTTPVPSQPRAVPPAAPAQAPTPAPAPVSTSSVGGEEQALPSPGGWQTAGPDHNRKQNRPQSGSVSNAGGDRGNVSAYIKNVTERIDASTLRSTLAKFGKVEYFDISRTKNAAFVEFAEPAGYQAAVAANPHTVNGEEINVEERRRGPNPYGGYGTRGGMRGGRGGNMDNRSPSGGSRGGYSRGDSNRGSYTPRGGRGNMTPRGRGMPQAA